MAAAQDSATKDHGAKKQAGGGEPKGKRARSAGLNAGAGDEGGSRTIKKKVPSSPAAAPASASSAHPESVAASSLVDVTVEDTDALDCRVCFLPLKAPIFHCDIGHVVCSPCCDRLKATGKCHVCDVATGSYRRCHDMERLVDSIHVPCAYAAHGCSPPLLACVHAPCHCPGEACSFVGSMEALLNHFSAVHSWPCITKADTSFGDINVHDGFNFVLADAVCICTGNKEQGITTSIKCLALLNVVRQPHARIITVHCIDPHSGQGPNSKEMQCKLTSTFRIIRSDLSNGLPKPDDCFQFAVPNSVIGDHDKDGIEINVRITVLS
ncbi:hypothetical protein BS78_09G050300 [Paspalum vaginatum]|nr:hypothetical protein BS78_09G050300 [Paspalum vaginatum]